MKENINISAILKDKPKGTKLYSPIFGDCTFSFIQNVTDAICVITNNNREFFDYKGLSSTLGEVMLFPSKLMRDWSKFAWKRGDVLQKNSRTQVIFDSFVSNTYEVIRCKYLLKVDNGNERFIKETNVFTRDYFKVSEEQRQCYINKIEEHCGGKLNMEILEIEKAQPEFKDGDIVTIMPRIGDKLIYLFKAEDNEKYYGHAFLDGNIAIVNDDSYCQKEFCTARPSTEKEKQQFLEALAKKHIYWDCEHKKILDMSIKVELKPFDRVLVRDYNNEVWRANLFSNYTSDGSYGCVCGAYNQCIPYNEETAKLIGTTNNWKG